MDLGFSDPFPISDGILKFQLTSDLALELAVYMMVLLGWAMDWLCTYIFSSHDPAST